MKVKKRIQERPELHESCTNQRKKFQIPRIRDVEEMRRLMARIPAVQTDDEDFECAVCRGQDHSMDNCPCLDKILPGVVLTPSYDSVCIGCGKIGEDCCSEGTYAINKECAACMSDHHWYLEKKCDKLIPPWLPHLPFTQYEAVPCPYNTFKDGPHWWRIINSKSDQETEHTEQQPRNVGKKIVRADKKRVVKKRFVKKRAL